VGRRDSCDAKEDATVNSVAQVKALDADLFCSASRACSDSSSAAGLQEHAFAAASIERSNAWLVNSMASFQPGKLSRGRFSEDLSAERKLGCKLKMKLVLDVEL
jgi:hypothetical protein